jgi:hypothetical protein
MLTRGEQKGKLLEQDFERLVMLAGHAQTTVNSLPDSSLGRSCPGR